MDGEKATSKHPLDFENSKFRGDSKTKTKLKKDTKVQISHGLLTSQRQHWKLEDRASSNFGEKLVPSYNSKHLQTLKLESRIKIFSDIHWIKNHCLNHFS